MLKIPKGYPRRGLRARRSPVILAKKVPANLRLDRDNLGQNCPSGIRTGAYKRSRLIMCTPSGCTYGAPFRVPHYNGCPLGHPYGTLWVPLEPGARRADERERKENKSRPIMGTHRVPIWAGCPTQPINGDRGPKGLLVPIWGPRGSPLSGPEGSL